MLPAGAFDEASFDCETVAGVTRAQHPHRRVLVRCSFLDGETKRERVLVVRGRLADRLQA